MKPVSRDRVGKGCDFKKNGGDIVLAPYQTVLGKLVNPYSTVNRMVVVHSTGAGKTLGYIEIVSQFYGKTRRKPTRIIILAPKKSVLDEFKKELKKHKLGKQLTCSPSAEICGENPEIHLLTYFQAKNIVTPNRYGQYTTKGKKYGGIKFFKGALVIMDEIHNIANPTYSTAVANQKLGLERFSQLLQSIPGNPSPIMSDPSTIVVGLTATPISRTPSDLAKLVNIMRGRAVFDVKDFDFGGKYVGEDGVLRRLDELVRKLSGLFVYYDTKNDRDRVPMKKEPQTVYSELSKSLWLGTSKTKKKSMSKPKKLLGVIRKKYASKKLAYKHKTSGKIGARKTKNTEQHWKKKTKD